MSDELVDQGGQPVDAAPDLGEGGNVESEDIFAQAAAAMAAADEQTEAEKAAKEAALLGEEPPAPEQEPEQEQEPAKDPEVEKPAEDKPDEPVENVSSGFHALRRKRKALKEREAQLQAREDRVAQATPVLQLFDALDAKDSTQALDVLARMAGVTTNQMAMNLIAHLSDQGAAPQDSPAKPLDRDALKREVLAEVQRELQTTQAKSTAQTIINSVMSVRTDPALANEHRALATMPEHKLYEETVASLQWARDNRPDLLNDPPAFRRLMAAAAQEELDSWNRAYGASGNGAPAQAKPDTAPAAPANPKQPDASARTTITDDDTSSGGATRELSEKEALAKVAALFGG